MSVSELAIPHSTSDSVVEKAAATSLQGIQDGEEETIPVEGILSCNDRKYTRLH